jgi:hypothetical protein
MLISSKRTILLTGAAFGVLGPPIGALIFFMVSRGGSSDLPRDLEFAAATIPTAYLIAAVPAFAAGALTAALAEYCRFAGDRFRLRRLIVGAIVGGTSGCLWQVSVFHRVLADRFFLCEYGAVAGALLATLFPLRRWLLQSSNNRFERSRVSSSVSQGGSR